MKYGFCKIGEYVTVLSGYAFKSEDFQAVGVPVIKIGNIKLGHVSLDDGNTECIPRAIADKLGRKFIVRKGDVLISLTGSHLTQPGSVVGRVGRYYYDSISVLNQRAGKIIVKDEEKSHLGFWFYLLSTKAVMTEIAMLAHGAANQANVSPKDIEKIWLPLPPLPIQKRIAAILSAYDELIENNNRRIALLEKMAEEIYREWFVRMRFPGHEKTKFHKGIPEGWEVKKLAEVVELCYGKALKEEERSGSGFPVYGSSGIVGYHKIKLAEGPGIIVGRKGNVGSIFWSATDYYVIDTAYFVRAEISFRYLFFALHSLNFVNNDSAVPGLNRSQAYSNFMLLPDANLLKRFDLEIGELLKVKENLLQQNTLLKQTRDALLPRLMSGKLDVENLDIAFPPGMQN
ncbi:restriction endonuclease subunit S [Leptonema illini]|uniref:Restriction modification system DNA specificity domain-containing protein n=1 Tax=Leptonema illini DSM 21528 TaxID=929563 RepID=H2CK06_9LEPT|nr:restriction endonuclease subunit S [Leptonema illini]EHQ06095.1 restriction modification system DNA specificity domain-containing protein [Leptonema illini DSM 21528]